MIITYHCAILIDDKWEMITPMNLEIDPKKQNPFDLMKHMLESQGIKYYLISYIERS